MGISFFLQRLRISKTGEYSHCLLLSFPYQRIPWLQDRTGPRLKVRYLGVALQRVHKIIISVPPMPYS